MVFISFIVVFGYNKVIEYFYVIIWVFYRNVYGFKIFGFVIEIIDVDLWWSYICNCVWVVRIFVRCLINWKNVRIVRFVNDVGIFCLNIILFDLDFSCWFWWCYWCRFWYVWVWGDCGLRIFIDICCICFRGWFCLFCGGCCCFWCYCFLEC